MILSIISIYISLFSLYISTRSYKVDKFRELVGSIDSDLLKKHSDLKMLFSIKPLKLRNWFTEKELNK